MIKSAVASVLCLSTAVVAFSCSSSGGSSAGSAGTGAAGASGTHNSGAGAGTAESGAGNAPNPGEGGSSDAGAAGSANDAGAPSGGTSATAGNGGMSSAGTSGSASAGTGGTAAMVEWCSMRSSDCEAGLETCPAFVACEADAACKTTLETLRSCVCLDEQMGVSNSKNCGAGIGAPGTLSGDALGCFDGKTGYPLICLLPIQDATCNDVQIVDPMIVSTQVAEVAPAPAGGAISDGTYVLTADITYTGVGGATTPIADAGQWQTLIVKGGTWRTVALAESKGGSHSTQTVTLAGTEFTPMQTCPTASVLPSTSYTATATTLTIFKSQDKELRILTKQ